MRVQLSDLQGSALAQLVACMTEVPEQMLALSVVLGGAESTHMWLPAGRRHQLRRHLALIGHPLVNDRQYTYGFASQLLRSGRKAQRGREDAQGDLPTCIEEESAAEMCVPEEEAGSDISDGSQVCTSPKLPLGEPIHWPEASGSISGAPLACEAWWMAGGRDGDIEAASCVA